MSRYGPPTKTMYCQTRECPNASGMDVKWYPDSIDGPGWPYTDCCPACDGDLHMSPLPEPEEDDE